jgi:hypothetical protein
VFAGTQTDECARLRAENERLRRDNAAIAESASTAEAECRAAEARVRELELLTLQHEREGLCAVKPAEQRGARLAAATALLVRWNRGDHPFTATRVFLKTVGAPENAQPDSDHAADDCSLRTNAFLASASFEYVGSASSPLPPAFEAANAARQPAAPTVYHSRPGSDVVVTDQPAAPARSIYDVPEDRAILAAIHQATTGQPAAPTRTAADEAVLDATDAIPESWLRGAVQASQLPRGLAPLAVAVLARRGLK